MKSVNIFSPKTTSNTLCYGQPVRALGAKDPLEISVGYQDLLGILASNQPSLFPLWPEVEVKKEQDQEEEQILHFPHRN